jgi:hypothetical protein
VSINRIAAMFGVTRQRISALLNETGGNERWNGAGRAVRRQAMSESGRFAVRR